MTLHPLLLLADYVEAYHAHQASFDQHPDGPGIMLSRRHIADAAHRLVQTQNALLNLDPAALRAQAEAGAGEAELLAELREALTAFDAATAEEDAAMEALMSASQNAPKNERGQYLDPGAVHRAAEPLRPRHEAAQDARIEAQDIIDGLAMESARLAVKLAGGLRALAQADAGGEAQ